MVEPNLAPSMCERAEFLHKMGEPNLAQSMCEPAQTLLASPEPNKYRILTIFHQIVTLGFRPGNHPRHFPEAPGGGKNTSRFKSRTGKILKNVQKRCSKTPPRHPPGHPQSDPTQTFQFLVKNCWSKSVPGQPGPGLGLAQVPPGPAWPRPRPGPGLAWTRPWPRLEFQFLDPKLLQNAVFLTRKLL